MGNVQYMKQEPTGCDRVSISIATRWIERSQRKIFPSYPADISKSLAWGWKVSTLGFSWWPAHTHWHCKHDTYITGNTPIRKKSGSVRVFVSPSLGMVHTRILASSHAALCARECYTCAIEEVLYMCDRGINLPTASLCVLKGSKAKSITSAEFWSVGTVSVSKRPALLSYVIEHTIRSCMNETWITEIVLKLLHEQVDMKKPYTNVHVLNNFL